jgi:hypothetical protein
MIGPPPIPRYPPPTVPVAKSAVAAQAKQRVTRDDNDELFEDEGRGTGAERPASRLSARGDGDGLRQQQQQQQQQQGATRPLSQERSPVSASNDKRSSSDLAPRNSISSSSSSRPPSLDRPSPPSASAPYLLPPRPYTISVSDADTQTPLAWLDAATATATGTGTGTGTGSDRRASSSGGAAVRAAAPSVLKYTGRAVPGSVINEAHVLFTVVQVLLLRR